jgi:hypothetical protein
MYDKCAFLSQAVAQIRGFVGPMSDGTMGWIVIVAYIGLIAVLTGADTFPAFRSLVDSFVKVDAIVRGFIGTINHCVCILAVASREDPPPTGIIKFLTGGEGPRV